MRNKILITITTLKGSKHYTINQLIKRFIFTLIGAVFIFVVISAISLKYLNIKVEKQSKRIEQLLKTKKNLEKRNIELEDKIKSKEKILNEINDKISDIENIINFTPPKDADNLKKLDLAKIDLIDKKVVLQLIPNGYPITFMGITSPFGWRTHPILNKKEFHSGIDLKAKYGTKVYAPADGIVEFANYHKSSGYGNLLIIDHNFGFKTVYGHLNKILVKRGDFVKKGDLIALTGSSGLSNGPHLHYEIRYIGAVLDPKNFLKWNLKNYNTIFTQEKKVEWQEIVKFIKWQRDIYKKIKE